MQEKEASLLRSLEAANLAALQASRQTNLPQLPHPLAFRSLLNGVMFGAASTPSAKENLVDNLMARGQRQATSDQSPVCHPTDAPVSELWFLDIRARIDWWQIQICAEAPGGHVCAHTCVELTIYTHTIGSCASLWVEVKPSAGYHFVAISVRIHFYSLTCNIHSKDLEL